MKSNLYYFYLLITISFISCSNKNSPKIGSKNDAFITYEKFNNDLYKLNNLPTLQLANILTEWKMLEDTLLYFIITDSILNDSQNIKDITRCAITKNSITDKLMWFINIQSRSYEDIIIIQQALNENAQEVTSSDIFRNAESFFKTLDNKPTTNKSSYQLKDQYINALVHWNNRGFSSTSDIREYIKEENILFINFLNHLYEYDGESVQQIISVTSEVTELMYKASSKGKLSAKELSIYMGIRTNRRLIQNAYKCIEAIKSGLIKTPAQAAMTISMLLNPYSNYNMCIGLRTKDQIKELKLIGRQIEPLIAQLKQQGLIDELNIDSLPRKFIKEYILMKMK